MGVLKVTDSDGNIGYLESSIDLTATSPTSPARMVNNTMLVDSGGNNAGGNSSNPIYIALTAANSGALLGPTLNTATQNALVAYADTTGTKAKNTSVLIDSTTGNLADVNFVGSLVNSAIPTAIALSASQNDYSPGTTTTLRLNPSANITITGFSGGVDGRFLLVENTSSSFTVTLSNASGSSQTANQLSNGGNALVLTAGGSALYQYDTLNTVWRLISFTPTSSDFTLSRNVTFSRYLILNQVTSAALAAQQDNYSLSNSPYWRLTSSAAITITGMPAPSAGTLRVLANVGTFKITLAHLNSSSSSSAQFQFRDSNNYVLQPNEQILFAYDGTLNKWVPVLSPRAPLGVYTVANLPTTANTGAIAHASNGRRTMELAGNGTGCPVWYDGSVWKTFYDNSTVAA